METKSGIINAGFLFVLMHNIIIGRTHALVNTVMNIRVP
jgi:hypothetical protein